MDSFTDSRLVDQLAAEATPVVFLLKARRLRYPILMIGFVHVAIVSP